jgi:hypothetical protein
MFYWHPTLINKVYLVWLLVRQGGGGMGDESFVGVRRSHWGGRGKTAYTKEQSLSLSCLLLRLLA